MNTKSFIKHCIVEVTGETTCQKCKGAGYYHMSFPDKTGRGGSHTQIVPCDFPGCHNGIIDREENRRAQGLIPHGPGCGCGLDEAKLRCTICGGNAKGKQWWNQDKGQGICGACAAKMKARGQEDIEQSYGKEGEHYHLPEGFANIRASSPRHSTENPLLEKSYDTGWSWGRFSRENLNKPLHTALHAGPTEEQQAYSSGYADGYAGIYKNIYKKNFQENPHAQHEAQTSKASDFIKECLIEVLTENLTEGFDPLSNAGPNSPQENPYPIWNNKMRNLEETEKQSGAIYKATQNGETVYWINNFDGGGNLPLRGGNVEKYIQQGYRLIELDPDISSITESEPTPESPGYESSEYDLYNWHKRGQKVQVKFFNNKTGTNDVQSGIIREPQKTQAIIRLDMGKSVVVPWKSVTPFMPDQQFGVNEIHPPGQYDVQGTGAIPLSSTFTEVNNEDPIGKPYASKTTDMKDYIPTISIIKWAVQYLGKPEFESRVEQLLIKAKVSSEEKIAHCIEFVAREALNQRKMQAVNEQSLPQSTSINWKCPHCSGVTKILLEIKSPADYISCSECDHCGKEINDPYLDNRIYEEVVRHFASRKILK